MASHALAPLRALEDPLAYLPCSSLLRYGKGQIIYTSGQAAAGLYLVIEGSIKVSRIAGRGREVVIDIYLPDEFFGESAVVSPVRNSEQALSASDSVLMSWSYAEIEEITAKKPLLGFALSQLMVKRCMESTRRIQSLSVEAIPQRLARALLRFGERMGARRDAAAVAIPPFTHELLGQYVATSREIVTACMARFRRQGYISYSRRGIVLYESALREWLRDSSGRGAGKVPVDDIFK